MKGILLKDDEPIRIFDDIDADTISYEFLTCGVNLRTYQWFMSGRCNYVHSADGKIELRETDDKELKTILEKRIEEVKRELNWLYMEESKLDVKSD